MEAGLDMGIGWNVARLYYMSNKGVYFFARGRGPAFCKGVTFGGRVGNSCARYI